MPYARGTGQETHLDRGSRKSPVTDSDLERLMSEPRNAIEMTRPRVISGKYRCACGNYRWELIPTNASTVRVPSCHGLMRFTWTFVEGLYPRQLS